MEHHAPSACETPRAQFPMIPWLVARVDYEFSSKYMCFQQNILSLPRFSPDGKSVRKIMKHVFALKKCFSLSHFVDRRLKCWGFLYFPPIAKVMWGRADWGGMISSSSTDDMSPHDGDRHSQIGPYSGQEKNQHMARGVPSTCAGGFQTKCSLQRICNPTNKPVPTTSFQFGKTVCWTNDLPRNNVHCILYTISVNAPEHFSTETIMSW